MNFYSVSGIGAGVVWLISAGAAVQAGATYLDMTIGDLIAFASFVGGPPTLIGLYVLNKVGKVIKMETLVEGLSGLEERLTDRFYDCVDGAQARIMKVELSIEEEIKMLEQKVENLPCKRECPDDE